ncbi:MAG: hypothetical protein IJ802_04545 [Kiritimatiellae bacterium]|nr:hypothetical protein [Kiritimatiellia bacterium]
MTDSEIYGLLKDRDAEAWRLVWENAVLAEAKSRKNSEMMHRWGLEAEELMCRLYWEMVHKGRLENYRNDGGSIYGFLRAYVRGYILKADPAKAREVPMGAFRKGDGEESDENLEENIALDLSDSGAGKSSPVEETLRREDWEEVQRCFAELWRKSPLKAYVHVLRLRAGWSSEKIKNLLGISSAANVDQMFKRATTEMREMKVRHGQE